MDVNGEICILDKVMFFGRNNVFKGILMGILDMVIGENRKVYLLVLVWIVCYIDGKYIFIIYCGEYRFLLLRIKNGVFFLFENVYLKKVFFIFGWFEINFGVLM